MSAAEDAARVARDLEADRALVLPHLFEGVRNHILIGQRTGAFLTAVLSNDLREAAVRPDPISLAGLPDLILFLIKAAPKRSWGSEAAVFQWRTAGGVAGGAHLSELVL